MMAYSQCQAITKSGEKCKLKANSTEYCHIHNPQKMIQQKRKNEYIQSLRFQMPKRLFSQRRGLQPISDVIQVDSISPKLRMDLWNILSEHVFLPQRDFLLLLNPPAQNKFIRFLWGNYFNYRLDDLVELDYSDVIERMFDHYRSFEWYQVYDFFELIINHLEEPLFVQEINIALAKELSAYRFIGDVFTNITSQEELEMLQVSLNGSEFPAVVNHLKTALKLMSDKENPDYRNSIKESISAVESLAKAITGKSNATLADCLKALERDNKLHRALEQSFLNLYGYTSNADGIRHAMSEEPNLTVADAKFFLLSCTSFINYLKSKI